MLDGRQLVDGPLHLLRQIHEMQELSDPRPGDTQPCGEGPAGQAGLGVQGLPQFAGSAKLDLNARRLAQGLHLGVPGSQGLVDHQLLARAPSAAADTGDPLDGDDLGEDDAQRRWTDGLAGGVTRGAGAAGGGC